MRICRFARIAAVTLCASLLVAGVSFAEEKASLKIGARSTFAGKHDIAIMKVLNGESDGASVKDQDLKKLSRSDPRVAAEILVLGKSGLYPDGTLLFRRVTSAATVKEVEKVLLGIDKDPKGRAALAAVGADRYIATGKKDFAELIKAMTLVKE